MASDRGDEEAAALAEAFGALSHPVRIRALMQFEGGARLSPTGLKETMPDVSFGTLAYHVRQLAGAGLLKPAGQVPRRGAVEHLYMLTAKGVTTAAVLSELATRL